MCLHHLFVFTISTNYIFFIFITKKIYIIFFSSQTTYNNYTSNKNIFLIRWNGFLTIITTIWFLNLIGNFISFSKLSKNIKRTKLYSHIDFLKSFDFTPLSSMIITTDSDISLKQQIYIEFDSFRFTSFIYISLWFVKFCSLC